MIEILSRWTQAVIYKADVETVAAAIVQAVSESADLSGAYLSGADLRSADLRSANLSGADLSGADLRSANLRSAYLSGADLSGADLRSANLRSANLSGAYLSGADLSGADLSGADLRSADLRSTNLSGADLTPIRDDLWAVLSASPSEVHGLRKAIAEGKISGTTYEGSCACLVGTIANIRHCSYSEIPGLTPDSSRPAEIFFLNIAVGDTPDTNQFSKLALEWVDQWLANVQTLIDAVKP